MVSAARLEPVEGPNLVLRLIQPDDAEYAHALRTDPTYSRHLSQVTGSAEDQRNWIIRYKQREAELQELYYVIERKDGVRCGLVRLYEISSESFTWGSWILDHNKPAKAALESAVLSFGVAFDHLNCGFGEIDVRIGNDKAENIYRRLKMEEVARDSANIYFRYFREQFLADRTGFLDLIRSEQHA